MNGEPESANGSRGRICNGTPWAGVREVTQLLADWSRGEEAALQKLTPLVYEELRHLAHRYMEGQRPDHTLQTTALVNEAYLRLVDQTKPNFTNRSHFFAVAAKAMRQILVDYNRSSVKNAARARTKLNWTRQRWCRRNSQTRFLISMMPWSN
jgi:RNA polymerase sigma factor (TIGR02999 family)